MSKWNSLQNNFFWVTYSTKLKHFNIAWLWMGRVYRININISLQATDLIDESQFKSLYERQQKEDYAGPTYHKAKRRPYHTGIYHNYNDKQLSSLPAREKQIELDRREAFARRDGVRPHVGPDSRTETNR